MTGAICGAIGGIIAGAIGGAATRRGIVAICSMR